MSYETIYAAAMRQRADTAASTPEAAAARLTLQVALGRAHTDTRAVYPIITAENAADAFAVLNDRIAYWRAELMA